MPFCRNSLVAYNVHGGEAHFEGRQQEESSECIGD